MPATKLKIHSRRSWGAKPPRPRDEQSPSQVRELFIHWPGGEPASWAHVDSVAEEEATMRSIQGFHMGPARGWSDFAYSFAVFPSGRIYRGRGMRYVPAAQLGHNTGTVAVIVFLGPEDQDKLSSKVVGAIRALREHCEAKAGRSLDVRPHRAVTSTECPGPFLNELANKL